jgi:hypothetical protein
MDNAGNILKKILLNMKYDSKKTLKENKLLLEEEKQYAMAWNGRTLELPLNAVINSTHNHSKFISKSVSDLETNFPLWSEACKIHKPKEYGKCLNDYKRKWINSVKDGSVRSFKIDGKQYYQIYNVHVPDKNNSPVLGTPDNLKIIGYREGKTGPTWTAYSNKPPKNIGGEIGAIESKGVNDPFLACKTKAKTELSKAVIFWKNWLNDPITIKKVKENWKDKSNFLPNYFNRFSVDSYAAWDKYFEILNNLNIIVYDDTTTNEHLGDFAYVIPGASLYNINVNCSLDDKDLLGTMVHEIQHLLYHVKPLNPAKKINNAFVAKNEEIDPMSNIFDITKLGSFINANTLDDSKRMEDASKKMEYASKNLNIPYTTLQHWKNASIVNGKKDPGYVCRQTEKMSNIMSIRRFLGIQPKDKITLDMLMPYITTKQRHNDISWVLMCWAEQNFPDINVMLDEINALAFKQGNKQPRIDDLPKPNFS